jgi:hypothetical protein
MKSTPKSCVIFSSFDGNGYLELDRKLISHENDMINELKVEFFTW